MIVVREGEQPAIIAIVGRPDDSSLQDATVMTVAIVRMNRETK
jgi:hypothetical protein